MARNYSVTGNNTSGTGVNTLICITGGTTCRFRWFDITIGSALAPQDLAGVYAVARSTAAGTGTAATVGQFDSLDIVTQTTSQAVLHTVEPTYSPLTNTIPTTGNAATGALLQIPLNMRATFRYVASPGAEFTSVASASNGLVLALRYAPSAMSETGTVVWFE
jgi:hypothetical protein